MEYNPSERPENPFHKNFLENNSKDFKSKGLEFKGTLKKASSYQEKENSMIWEVKRTNPIGIILVFAYEYLINLYYSLSIALIGKLIEADI